MRQVVSGLLLLTITTLAMAANAGDALAKIFQPIHRLSGQFTQIVYDGNARAIAKSKGVFAIERPNHFRWQVKTPIQQLTIANGKNIWLYQPDLAQVTVSPMTQKVVHTPLAILSGSSSALHQSYTITHNSVEQYTLLAKQQNSAFNKIILILQGMKIHQMQLFDSLGQKTIVSFSKVVLNGDINKNSFRFTVPKGIDVIRN